MTERNTESQGGYGYITLPGGLSMAARQLFEGNYSDPGNGKTPDVQRTTPTHVVIGERDPEQLAASLEDVLKDAQGVYDAVRAGRIKGLRLVKYIEKAFQERDLPARLITRVALSELCPNWLKETLQDKKIGHFTVAATARALSASRDIVWYTHYAQREVTQLPYA